MRVQYILAAIAVVTVLAGVVLAAIVAGALWALIGGVALFCVTAVALLYVSAKPISVIAEAKRKSDEERHRHIERIVESGLILRASSIR